MKVQARAWRGCWNGWCGWLSAALAAWAALCASPLALAGTLTKADVQAMFPPPLLVGEKLGHLPVWPVFVRTGQGPVLQNHVFETVDLEPVAGYGGKPINVLVVLDRDGAFVLARLLSHTEPIFRSVEGTAVLDRFAQQYQGITVHHQVQVLGPKAQRTVTATNATLHGIVAGTVTATAINRSMLESAAQVAQQSAQIEQGMQAPPEAKEARTDGAPDDQYQRTGFNGLAAAGLVQPWLVDNRALEAQFAGTAGAGRDAEGMLRPRNAAIDLWLAFVGMPQAGRNLLAAPRWREVRALREQAQPVLLVLDSSRYPLLGSKAEAREGRYRGAELELAQGSRRFALQELAWAGGLRMSGQHSGVGAGAVARYYRILPAADGAGVDIYRPVSLTLQAWRSAGAAPAAAGGAPSNERVSVKLAREFSVPEAEAYRPVREAPRWLAAWSQRAPDLALLGAALLLLAAGLLAQRQVAATRRRLLAWRTAFAAFTLVYVGWVAQGQLTIVTLTSALEAWVAGRSLEFLLLDPIAVVLWAFTLLTLLVWGRGTFCGWLCPFGALQELIGRGARWLRVPQRRLSVVWDRRAKRLKYAVLAALLGAAVLSPAAAEWMVEVEPFKTSISMYFQRSWPYVAWAGLCLALGVFVYRGYCRYLCPLGAALAVAGRLRRWPWIARRAQCGTPCQTCRHRCDYQAITPAGRVDYAECFQCLDCVQLHDDAKHCLPLVARARGKTIPIRAVAAGADIAAAAAAPALHSSSAPGAR